MRKIFRDIKNVPAAWAKNAKSSKNEAVAAAGNARSRDLTVKLSVEDRRNQSGQISVHRQQDSFADFSSNPAVDEMGFPILSKTHGDVEDTTCQWEADFGDNGPFASDALATAGAAPTCAWCQLPAVKKPLKLCSRCRGAYYCGRECQSKDWVEGRHAVKCCAVLAEETRDPRGPPVDTSCPEP